MSSAESHGFFPTLPTHMPHIFIYTQDGFTPLHAASHNGHTDAVEQLLKAHANPHALTEVSCMICTKLVYSTVMFTQSSLTMIFM